MPKAKPQKRKPQFGNDTGVTFDMVRELALALPGVEEGRSYGTHTFRTRGKMLARFHVRLKNVELNLLRGLMEDAWRNIATKRAIAEYDARD